MTIASSEADNFNMPISDAKLSDFATIEEAAVILGCSSKTVERRITAGKLSVAPESASLGRKLVLRSDLAKQPRRWERAPKRGRKRA